MVSMPRRSIHPSTEAAASVFEVIDGTIQSTVLTSAQIAKQHLLSRRNDGTHHSRLYLLRGLWLDWVTVFEAYFRINATFLESHMRRRPYQHHSWTRPVQSGAFSVSYPEVVRFVAPTPAVSGNSAASAGDLEYSRMKVDTLFNPDDCPLEGLTYGKDKRIGALLNHAASWSRNHRNGDIDFLLLLDEEVWTEESLVRKDFHRNDDMGQTTTPDGGDLRYPCGSMEILSCSLEVLICQTLQVAKKLPKDMYELNMYLHEISIAKWEAYFDIYTAFQRSFSSNIYSSSGIGSALVAQQKKVCEEAQDHIQWNMRVEALNSIITDKDPMATKFRIDNWKRLQRNFDAARKPTEFASRDQSEVTATSGSSGVDIREATSKQEAEDAQQSINRLAYLGGIFLPFSIIAAIFSMGQEFAAGMPLFYVYWVISLPLSLGVLATIYADSIRRLTPSQLHMQKKAETRLNINAADDEFEVNHERPLGWLGAYANLLRPR